MRIRWRNFELPSQVKMDAETASDSYGLFVVEPFERGFGTTIGNGLRRVLLSSIEGTAVTSVKIDGVVHEYSTIPGVLEDVSHIVLNLKEGAAVVRLGGLWLKTAEIEIESAALDMALKKADEVGADLVMATDPDSDRVGIAVRDDQGKLILINKQITYINPRAELVFNGDVAEVLPAIMEAIRDGA